MVQGSGIRNDLRIARLNRELQRGSLFNLMRIEQERVSLNFDEEATLPVMVGRDAYVIEVADSG